MLLLQCLLWKLFTIYKTCANKSLLSCRGHNEDGSRFNVTLCDLFFYSRFYFFSLHLSLSSRSLELLWTIVSSAGYGKILFLCGKKKYAILFKWAHQRSLFKLHPFFDTYVSYRIRHQIMRSILSCKSNFLQTMNLKTHIMSYNSPQNLFFSADHCYNALN